MKPSPGAALLVALLATALLESGRAAACGPCGEGDVWDAARIGDELEVVTNFGLLSRSADVWHLDCEEVFGGLLSGAAFSTVAQVASTSVGFFRRMDACAWSSATDGASNTWFLDFALVPEPDEVVFALVVDRETQESDVERSLGGEPFTTLASFPSDSGFRKIAAAGTPAHVFVTGYTFGPRVFHVAFSDDVDGGSFALHDFEAEGEDLELEPLDVDPELPTRLWLRGKPLAEGPGALFRFDAGDAALTRVFTLEGEERLADAAFSDGRILLAGRALGASSIYTADANSLDFEKQRSLALTLSCLSVDSGVWLACNSDFTRSSPWLVASSDDEGESWRPELVLEDLGRVASCGATCATTTGWLFGRYGAFDGAGSDAGVPPRFEGGSPATDDAGTPGGGEAGGDLQERSEASGCACAIGTAGAGTVAALWFGFVAALLGVRASGSRRRASSDYASRRGKP